jgi:hypothetical protein
MWWPFGSKKPYPFPVLESYMGAGCIFTNGKHVLAGIQRQSNMLSGFGGRREDSDKDYVHTAHRELIEELFGHKEIPEKVYTKFRQFEPLRILEPLYGSFPYINIVYSFKDLQRMIRIVNSLCCASMFYHLPPDHVSDLVFWREHIEGAEVTTLSILPIATDMENGIVEVEGCFVSDVSRLHNWLAYLESRSTQSTRPIRTVMNSDELSL